MIHLWRKRQIQEKKHFVFKKIISKFVLPKFRISIIHLHDLQMNTAVTSQWDDFIGYIADNLGPQQFSAWFGSVRFYSFQNQELRITVPSSYIAQELDARFLPLIKSAIKKVYGEKVDLIYRYDQVSGEPDTAVSVHTSNPSSVILEGSRLGAANPFVDQPVKPFYSQLNPQYNFENYCTSDSNRVAAAIAQSIADDPSNKTFNPLFVFGSVGVGKTHLIQAIGIRIKENNPNARVLYVTARLFQSQYTAANHKGQINNFFHFYQSIDTLIVDDIQDLAGKAETQNTFFHIFNQLQQNNRQIIMSSDCPPSEMDGFEARLLSRFKWGASVELGKPDIDLRRRVLYQNAAQDGLELPDEVIEYIAENVTESVRELVGVVASLVAQATVLNCGITLDLARIVVAQAIRTSRRKINFEMLANAVAIHFKVKPDSLFTATRKREVSDARQVVMYLAKKLVGLSYKSIGMHFGRTHATVMYACRTIEERLQINKELRQSIDTIVTELHV